MKYTVTLTEFRFIDGEEFEIPHLIREEDDFNVIMAVYAEQNAKFAKFRAAGSAVKSRTEITLTTTFEAV